jgi:hypothetical protein
MQFTSDAPMIQQQSRRQCLGVLFGTKKKNVHFETAAALHADVLQMQSRKQFAAILARPTESTADSI